MTSSSTVPKTKDKSPGPHVARKRYSITIDTGSKTLKSKKMGLLQPDLEDLAGSIKKALAENFESVTVKVVTAPNMQEWCGLAERGISGNCRLVEVGGQAYLMDPKYHHVKFQLPDVVKACDMHGTTLVVGSGAASPIVVGKNAELLVNALVPGPTHNRFVKIDKPDKKDEDEEQPQKVDSEDELSIGENRPQSKPNDREPKPQAHAFRKHSGDKAPPTPTKSPTSADDVSNPLELLPDMKLDQESSGNKKESTIQNTTDSSSKDALVPVIGSYPSEETGCFVNLFLCDGKPGSVIYIKVNKRKGRLNFTNSIREGMKACKGVGKEHQIGMGGLFKVNKGKVKGHIMPGFNKQKMDEKNTDELNNWLRYYEFGPNLLMVSCLLSDDPTPEKTLHLRLERTHFYGLDKNVHEGGQYHYDVTPDEIEYEGYFSLAEKVYRVEDAYDHVTQDSLINRIKTP